jgi:hypothetical protein
MKKRAMMMFACAIIFIVAVNVYVRRYTGEVKEGGTSFVLPELLALPQEKDQPVAVQPGPAGRAPDDPAKLGIVIVSQMDRPTGPGGWDALMKRIFEESGALKTKEGQAVVRKMQMRPEQYKATIKRLDNEIIKAEMAAYRNTMDPLLKMRLEVLYQMKALSHVLEKNGIVNPQAAALPTFGQGAGSFSGDGPR